MVKKKFDLSKDMITMSKEMENAADNSVVNANYQAETSKPPALPHDKDSKDFNDAFETVTLRIKKSIKKEFKLWCVENNIQMNDAFVEAWLLLKENRK
jgi:hypothetical protein